MAELLRFEGVSRRYGGLLAVAMGRDGADVTALTKVDFAIAEGEALGLIGPSGSGKSTVARLGRGLESPSSGRIFFDGAPLRLRTARARRLFGRKAQLIDRLAMQELNARLSAAQLVRAPLDKLQIGSAASRLALAERVLDEVGVPAMMWEAPSRELPDDLAQRVAIARALAPGPRLLICDEAVGALDAPSRARVLTLLNGLRSSRGVAVLFISHDLALIRGFCERVVVLSAGQVVETQPIEALFSAPQRPETRALIAASDIRAS